MSGIIDSYEEMVTFTVVRTSDARRKKITLPLSKKLGELKETLAGQDFFGPISTDRQRLFYMGRELKSCGRSLHTLGLGKFNNHVLHLHVRPGRTTMPGAIAKRRRPTTNKSVKQQSNGTSAAVIDLLDDSDDEVTILENNVDGKRFKVS